MAGDAGLRRRIPRMLAAGLLMCAVLWGVDHTLFAAVAAVQGLRWVALGLLVASGLAAYAMAGQFLGGFDLREAARMVLGRGRG